MWRNIRHYIFLKTMLNTFRFYQFGFTVRFKFTTVLYILFMYNMMNINRKAQVMKKVVYLSGLPRSGSTLLANVLAMHPEIQSTPSSPLCGILTGIRKTISNDAFFKAQLDSNLDGMQNKVKRTMLATIQAWSDDGAKPIVVDKNRGWLFNIEWMKELIPNFKMIVTIRDLRDVYSSIEKQHRKTLFIEFPDGLEHNIVDVRASNLFADGGVIGGCLKAIKNIGDVPNIIDHLLIWRYEDLLNNPEATINKTFEFIGVKPYKVDLNHIVQSTQESDSHYNMKYLHSIKSSLERPNNPVEAPTSPRIVQEIMNRFEWYYRSYYNDYINAISGYNVNTPIVKDQLYVNDEALIRQIESAIKDEVA